MSQNLYSCAGLRLRSTIPLLELAPADDPGDTRPIVTVREGPVPESLPGSTTPHAWFQVAGDTAQLNVTVAARFRVTGGSDVVFEPAPDATERNIRTFLLGSALGLVCHQRGILPLHANAVEIDGVAMAFAGASGAGKSTLAAYFRQRGYRVLCDDVCMVSFVDGRPLAWPGLRRLRLWGDAAEAFGHDTASLERAMDPMLDTREKYLLALDRDDGITPLPLERLYVLERAESQGAIQPIAGVSAVHTVMQQTYRPEYLRPLGLRARNFGLATALLGHMALFRAERRWGFDVFASEAERLEAHLRTR